jgi:hypothetical protein
LSAFLHKRAFAAQKGQKVKNTGYTSRTSVLAAILLIVFMLPVFWIGKYNRLTADDYDYSIETHAEIEENGASIGGLIRAAWEGDMAKYNTWQGLYTSGFVLAFQPGIFGSQYYAWSPVIVCVCIFLGLWGCAHILQKRLLDKKLVPDLLLALFLTFVIVQQMPYPNQGIYWFNGAMNYTPYCILDFLVLSLMLEAFCGTRREAITAAIFASILSFLISGGNHVTSFLNILMLALVTLVFFVKKKFWSLPPLFAACFGFLLMYLAPGTRVRESSCTKQGIFSSIVLALFQGVKSISGWVTLGFLCTLLLLTPLALAMVRSNTLHLTFRWPIVPLFFSYCLVSAMWFVPKYAMGNFGAGRLENVVWITFLLLAFLNYAYLLGWAGQYVHIDFAQEKMRLPKHLLQGVAGLLCLFAILGCTNGGNCEYGTSVEALVEIAIGNASAYAQECDARIAAFEDSSTSAVTVEEIKVKATLLFISDLKEDPAVWPNTSTAAYYGKESIAMTSSDLS